MHEEARKLLESGATGATTRALSLLDDAVRRHPKSEPLQRLTGIAAFRAGSLERAARAFGAAIELAPDFPFNYLKLASLELCARQDAAAANRTLSRLWARLPKDVASRDEAAGMLARCGAVDQAIDLHLALARLSPATAWAHRFKAGQLYDAAGRPGDAVRLLEMAVAEAPSGRAEPSAQLGAVYRRLGRTADARREFRRALEASPDAALKTRLTAELERLPSDSR